MPTTCVNLFFFFLPCVPSIQVCTFQVSLPSCELQLGPRDDAAEFDESSDQEGFKDDSR